MTAAFDGFDQRRISAGGIELLCRVGGSGPPLLLLHGHPQTHWMWHRVAPALAESFTTVLADLRGYGDSGIPPATPNNEPYSKRVMAADQVALMEALGFERFQVLAHDRGARVAHRLARDYPAIVERMMLLDIAPTLAMYEQTGEAFARAYWHWFFLIRPAPFPETLIEADPEGYLRAVMGTRSAGMRPFSNDAVAEYLRCLSRPGAASAICEDYRASAGIDLEHDRADREAGARIVCPTLVLWGADGVVGRLFDPIAEWSRVAEDVQGEALPCGHYLAEEEPARVIEAALDFFRPV